MDVTMPDGTLVQGVPEGITKSQLLSKFTSYQQDSDKAQPESSSQISRQPSVGMDVAKTVGSNLAQGALGVPLGFGDLGNQLVAGPQLLGRGVAEGVDKLIGVEPQERDDLWQPFYGSNNAVKDLGIDYQPQTVAGQAAAIPAQLAGALVAGKGLNASAPKMGELLANENSGTQRKPPTPLPTELQPLRNLPDAAKGTMFAKKPNPIESGLKANHAISEQYGKDVEIQQNLYKDLNAKGSALSVKTPDLYSKLGDLTAYLEDKVAVDSPEHRALTELKEIQGNLSSKYGIEGTPDKTAQLPSWKQSMVVKKGTEGQAAYGIEPSDLVEIKTVLNSGLKPNKFTTAGSGKILMFKKYVQDALDTASQVSPEFGQALKVAEKQASRNGIYKSPELRTMWSPEDYVAYKAKVNNPEQPGYTDSTITRSNMFLQNLNSARTGRASVVARILGPEQSQQIFRDAILHGKATQPSVKHGIAQLPLHPIRGAKTIGAALIAPEKAPLSDLANQIKRMKK